MALQLAQLNGMQAQAIYALANMDQAVENAEGRVQQATDKTFSRMQEALSQSEINNRTLAERNTALCCENISLEQRLREITAAKKDEIEALKQQMQVKEAQSLEKIDKLKASVASMRSPCEKVLTSINSISPYLLPALPAYCQMDQLFGQCVRVSPDYQFKNGAIQTIIKETNVIKDQITKIENT
jgi:hypothetical protein